MSDNITRFPVPPGGRGGSGSDGSDLSRRVARIEESSERVERTLERMDATLRRVEIEMAEVKGRMTGLEDRFGAVPTTVQLLGFAVAVLVAGGLFQWLGPRLAPPPQPIVIQAPPR